MKILLVVPEFPPDSVGGGGVVYKNLLKQYIKKGHSVTVLIGDHNQRSFFKKIYKKSKNGVDFYYVPEIPYPKKGNFITAMPPSFPAILQMYRVINKNTVDVAHVHGFGHIFIDIACIYLKLKKIPYVFTLHGFPNPAKKSASVIYNFYARTLGALSLKLACKVTAVSNYTLNNSYNCAKKKSVVVRNGLESIPYPSTPSSHTSDELYIFSAGRIVDMKGFDRVIRLLPYFKSTYKKVVYFIAGEDAGYKQRLINLSKELNVSQNVSFVGKLERKEVYKYINQANIIAITSRWEPFNIFALESMYFNKIVITSFEGGLKQVLGGYNKAININNKDIISEYRSKVNLKGNFNPSDFSWPSVAVEYIKILNSCSK